MPSTPSKSSADQRDVGQDPLGPLEHMERQLDQMRSELAHSHRLTTLGTLASIVAHEFNNILTPIISYAQLALSKPDDHALMRKAVEKGLIGAERASRISSSMLGFAQQDTGTDTAELHAAIMEAVTCLAREPDKDGINLEIDVPRLELAIAPISLQQVLLNLMLNARKAMRRQGGKLTIRAKKVENQRVRIDISDTGPGIPEAIKHRLFEPFVTHQIHEPDGLSPLDDDTRGTGLGLCICQDLIRSAGGSISVDSEPGRGATFHIDLPIAPDRSDSQRAA